MEEENTYFIAIDGDDVGPHLRSFIIGNDIAGSSKYSNALKDYFKELEKTLIGLGATIIFRGGDSILAYHRLDILEKFATEAKAGICGISVGLGQTAEYAYLALQLAKARGKSQVVLLSGVKAKTLRVIPFEDID